MTAESINNPAIGDLDGDGKDDIVVATNEVYGGADSGGGDVGFGGLLATAGSTLRVYAVKSTARTRGGPFFPGWPVKPGGMIQNVLPLIGPGHDPALVKVGGDAEGGGLGHREHRDDRLRRATAPSRRSSRAPAARAP